MINSRGFEECLLAALICGGLLAIVVSPAAGLVLGAALVVAAIALTPCGCVVTWDAKRTMRAVDAERGQHLRDAEAPVEPLRPLPHSSQPHPVVIVHGDGVRSVDRRHYPAHAPGLVMILRRIDGSSSDARRDQADADYAS